MTDLDALMDRLGVRPHDREGMREALIDTYEVGKDEVDWVIDAGLVSMTREGKLHPPEPGSPMAKLLARTKKPIS